MNIKLSFSILSIAAVSLCFANTALADGMPFGTKAPEPILTPLDKALDDIEETQTAPVSVTPEAAPPAQEAAAAPPAPVTDLPPPVPETRIVEVQPNASFFGLSVGMYDPFTHNEKAPSFNVEWQPGVKIAGFLQPIFGGMVATNGSMLGYGGVGVPFNITDHVFLMPSVAVGAYKKGGGYDLDRTLAFRVGTELAYQFDDKSRIGLNMHVISNGTSLDRSDRTEVIGLTYTMPFSSFSSPDSGTITPSEALTPPAPQTEPALPPPSDEILP